MQQLIDVQTVIKSSALISAVGAIDIPRARPKRRREKKMKRRWRGEMERGIRGMEMDMGGIKDE